MSGNALRNKSGFALVIALMILLLVTLIGISSISATVFQTNISGNERVGTGAFYAAEAGIQVGFNQLPDTSPIARAKIGEESYYWSGGQRDRETPKSLGSLGLHQKPGYDTAWAFKRYQVNAAGECFGGIREIEVQVSVGPYASGTQYNN